MSGKTYILRRGMVGLPNGTVHDRRLSYQALGVLTVLLGRPDGAPAGYRDLIGRGLGQAAMLTALRELDAAGYRHVWRRPGLGGRFQTDILVSEEPVSQEEAQDRLMARSGQGRLPVDNGSAARGIPTHGPTWEDTVLSQVAPCVGSPQPGRPEPGPSPHVVPTQGDSSLRSESPRDPNASERVECPHRQPDGLNLTRAGRPRCALCRRGLTPGVAPWDAETPVLFDPAQRAAGEHLEQAS